MSWDEEREHLLQSCSMVAHCSDFFQVWASSSFRVRTASSSKLMLSCGGKRGVRALPAVDGSCPSASPPASHSSEGMRDPHRLSLRNAHCHTPCRHRGEN